MTKPLAARTALEGIFCLLGLDLDEAETEQAVFRFNHLLDIVDQSDPARAIRSNARRLQKPPSDLSLEQRERLALEELVDHLEFSAGGPKSLREIGERIGCTAANVDQIVARACSKLRKRCRIERVGERT